MSQNVLPDDLWRYIGSKLDSPADRVRFRAVSKSWTSLLREPPWLMLAESDEESESESDYLQPYNASSDDDEPWLAVLEPDFNAEAEPTPPRGFVRLGEEQIHKIDVPDLHQARCVGSTGNWLITINLDKTIRLVNPFSTLQFFLPSPLTFQYGLHHRSNPHRKFPAKGYRDNFIMKMVLSSSPSGDCVAMALHHAWFILAMARPGDPAWTTVHTADAPLCRQLFIEDVIFYKQRFYAIDVRGRLIVCDHLGGNLPTLSYLTTTPHFEKHYLDKKVYLVEWLGELLMVVKNMDEFEEFEDPCMYYTNGFQVYKFDFSDMMFKELESLGEYSLFLGFNTSTSVLASDYFGLIKRNSIYFTDDYITGYRGNIIPGGHDMGVFDLEDQTITPHYQGTSTSYYSPPVWIVPT